jgi:hypothetical protein
MKKPDLGPAGDIIRAAKRLTPNQTRVLVALPVEDDFYFVSLDWISHATGMDRRRSRIIVRQLARIGLAEYKSGLFTSTGAVAGAGYGITTMGKIVAQIIVGD